MNQSQMRYLLFFIAPLFITACSSSEANQSEQEEEIARRSHVEPTSTEVTTMIAEKGEFALELISNGKLEAREKAVVPFTVQEQIVKIAVQEGDVVTKGETLARLDDFTYQKQLDEAKNAYEQALIDLDDMLLGYGHQPSDSASMPDNILKMARIRSGYNSAVTNLERARRSLERTRLKSPINGVVANLEARENTPSSSYNFFCEVLDVNTMQLEFPLLESELNNVQEGQMVEVFPFAVQDTSFKGRVMSINPSVDDQGMIRITASVPNPSHQLMDGMNARVLLKNTVPECLIIPKEAVLYRQNRKVVFVHENGKAIWKYVKTGHENSSEVTITEGLEEGWEVIVGNNLNLAHESEIKVN